MYGEINGISLSDVSSTMLLTLYGRVIESRSQDPLLSDPKAEEIVAQINDSMLHSDRKPFRKIAQFKISKQLSVHTALRAKQYDSYTLEFMRQHPRCTVVNLGCGLDTRFWRIDDGEIRFFDLDLPEVIKIKLGLVQETDRYKMVGHSVFDYEWMDTVLKDDNPVIFLAEGLFMYLPKEDVKALISVMGQRVKTGQLVAEMAHEKYTRGINRRMLGLKFKYEMGSDKPMYFQCGIKDSDEMEAWSPRLHLIDDWSYFDADAKKLGWMRMFRHFKYFRKAQWTVRYRIGE